jgi:hypothetical protein
MFACMHAIGDTHYYANSGWLWIKTHYYYPYFPETIPTSFDDWLGLSGFAWGDWLSDWEEDNILKWDDVKWTVQYKIEWKVWWFPYLSWPELVGYTGTKTTIHDELP